MFGVLGVAKIANLIEFELRTWEEEASAIVPPWYYKHATTPTTTILLPQVDVNNGEAFQTNDSSISRLKVSAINFYGECCGFTLYGADV